MCNIAGNSEDAKISIGKSIQLWLPAHLKFLGKIIFSLRTYLNISTDLILSRDERHCQLDFQVTPNLKSYINDSQR